MSARWNPTLASDNKRNIVVLGKDGQLGRALVAHIGTQALAYDHEQIDLRDYGFIAKLESLTAGRAIAAIMNAAAYTQVDKAESEGRDEAFRVNHAAVAELAQWCAVKKIPLVHYSTDYVFDGSGSHPRNESALSCPINAYGHSKLAGEHALMASACDYLLFRTSWVYDAWVENFFTTILKFLGEKESLRVVADQIGAPTYAEHLAQASLAALMHADLPAGLYHLCASGETSWYGFSQAIFTLARSHDSGEKSWIKCNHIDPVSSSDYPLPARRPLNSRLDCSKAQSFGIGLPHWEDGLKACIAARYEH